LKHPKIALHKILPASLPLLSYSASAYYSTGKGKGRVVQNCNLSEYQKLIKNPKAISFPGTGSIEKLKSI
jgi:hypothetical protein